MTKKEVFDYINSGIDKNGSLKKEKCFSKHFPELYQEYKQINFPEPIDSLPFKQKIWHFLNDIYIIPVCKICGNPVSFGVSGYRTYCSNRCIMQDRDIKDKIKQINLEKYGTESYTQTNECKNKIKQTCLDRYGVDNYAKTKECQDKFKQTNLERYGKEYYQQTDDFKEKSKQTCLERYGLESYSQTDEYKNKVKQTCLNRYGVDNYSQTDEYKNKMKEINLERYGKEYYQQTDDFKEKSKQTCLERYGVDNYAKTKECQDKFIQTNLERYGVDNYAKTKECIEKIKQTCLERYGKENYTQSNKCIEKNFDRYGVEYYTQSPEFKDKVRNTNLEKYGVEYYSQTDFFKEKQYNTKKHNNSFNSSSIEKLFDEFLKSLNIEYISQYKSIEYPYSCDFYIPFLDLYIEIQGNWTHGSHPFDENNTDDLDKLSIWKERAETSDYYKQAIYTWTDLDVRKRITAKKNNLNYLEIFSDDLDKSITIFENHISNMIIE